MQGFSSRVGQVMAMDLEQRHLAAPSTQVCVVGGAGGIGQPLSMLMAMDPNVPISIIIIIQRLLQTGFHCGDSKVSELCVYVAASNFGGCWTCRLFFPSAKMFLVARLAGLDAGHGSGRGCCSRPVAFEHEV